MRNWRIVTSAYATFGSVPAEIRYYDEKQANRNVDRRGDPADTSYCDEKLANRNVGRRDVRKCPGRNLLLR